MPREAVRRDAQKRSEQLQAELKTITKEAIGGHLTAEQFQGRFAVALKTAYIQMGVTGRGGTGNTYAVHYLQLGTQLKKEYGFLRGFTQDLIDGKLSEKQAIARAGQYGMTAMQAFSAMEKTVVVDSALTEGRRSLRAGAAHCESCLSLATNPRWVPVEEITAIGVDCQCRGNCQCVIDYRRG